MADPTKTRTSAGLLLYRRTQGELELFLVHPGGLMWKNKDNAHWTIPKGLVEEGETLLEAACREFEEETGIQPVPPYLPLASVRQRSGKVVHAWAWEGDADPETIVSNQVSIEFPRGSGRWIQFPEVDRAGWFSPTAARVVINPAQIDLIVRLQAALGAE